MNEDQKEEIMALEAILPPDEFSYDEDNFAGELRIVPRLGSDISVGIQSAEASACTPASESTFRIRFLPPVKIKFKFLGEYPEHEPPEFWFEGEWLTEEHRALLERRLLELWRRAEGSVVLFLWYQDLSNGGIQDALGLHENLFVEREDQIKCLKHFDEKQRAMEFREETHLCLICYSDVSGDNFEVLPTCGHSFCRDCLSRHCSALISDSAMERLVCPDQDCDKKLDPILVRRLTGDAEFERYDAHLLNFAIRSMSHTVWCPKIECQHPAQVSEGDNLGQCPACGFAFCTRCDSTYHGPTDCKQDQEDDAGTDEDHEDEDLSQNGVDLAELEKIMIKHGTLTARTMLEQTVKRMFSHMSAGERWNLKTGYSAGPGSPQPKPEVKAQWDELYGEALMEYFVSAEDARNPKDGSYIRSHHSFSRYINALTTEGRRDKSNGAKPNLAHLFMSGINVKPCPNCYCPIQKDGGCNHMHCAFCNTHFCWDCLQPPGHEEVQCSGCLGRW